MGNDLDPITFEVLRHKVEEIVAEAYHTIGRVSGSPVVVESGDHQEVICKANGEIVAIGAGAIHWVRSIAAGIVHVRTAYADNPGFAPGDQFMLNDTAIAANHAPDVQLLAPVFCAGEIIAWVGTASHQSDIGGMSPGGHHTQATEVYAEGFQSPGIKLVEEGVIRKDVEATFANMVRQPAIGLLDLRAKIAANNVMRERLLALLARYGPETIRTLFDELINHSESRLRARLARIADGEWTGRAYAEGRGPDGTFSLSLRLIKRGNSLTFDYTGTAPQSPGSENIGGPGAMSISTGVVLVKLAHDLPWNEGLFRPMDFVLPRGTLVNPEHPGAVSCNIPAGAASLVSSAAQQAVSQMLATSDRWRPEASAVRGVNAAPPIFAGRNVDGSSFTALILDGGAGGAGALTDADGESTSGNAWTIRAEIANVETTEMLFPLMYLWRRQVTDSAGSGTFRGGVGIGEAIVPWGTEEVVLVTVGCGQSARGVLGLHGGYPGANLPIKVIRDADVPGRLFRDGRLALEASDLGEGERRPGVGVTTLAARDALVVHNSAGGGGYGDPLARDPEAVLADVAIGLVSSEMAQEAYGVVIDGDAVDDHATGECRQRMRDERLRVGTRHPWSDATEVLGIPSCPYCVRTLPVDAAGVVSVLAWYEPTLVGVPNELAPADARFVLRSRCCPACAGLLDVALEPRETMMSG